jgi:hypothetical protein
VQAVGAREEAAVAAAKASDARAITATHAALAAEDAAEAGAAEAAAAVEQVEAAARASAEQSSAHLIGLTGELEAANVGSISSVPLRPPRLEPWTHQHCDTLPLVFPCIHGSSVSCPTL